MKKLISSNAEFGPFNSIELVSDAYICDGISFPVSVVGQAIIDDWVEPAPDPQELIQLKQNLSNAIDSKVAEVYSRWLRFDAEYVEREAAARKFLLDGTASSWVTSFATPAGLTETQAATLIVQQADSLRAALVSLGALRMRKYEVKSATTAELARSTADTIFTDIQTVASNLE